MIIPSIPAKIKVRDENPADGWVSGCDGASVVLTATGVPDAAGTAREAEDWTVSPKVPCTGSCISRPVEISGDGKSPEARGNCRVVRPSAPLIFTSVVGNTVQELS